MGAWQSTAQNIVLQPSAPQSGPAPGSPPHPSRSQLASTLTRPQPRNALSYFLSTPTQDLQHTHSNPTLHDINRTISILSHKLPPELVLRVIDESQSWAGCRTLLKKEIEVVSAQPGMRRLPRVSGWRTGQEDGVGLKDEMGEIWYLVSQEVGCEDQQRHEPGHSSVGTSERPVSAEKKGEGTERDQEEEEDGRWVREIVIETLSKDQGWSSAVTANPALYGTYDASYSWFEISILRDNQEVEGSRRSILNNVHAGQYYKSHRIVLGSEDGFVKQLKRGDRVVLWVRAQYPGWRNLVREAAITLFCAPFPQA